MDLEDDSAASPETGQPMQIGHHNRIASLLGDALKLPGRIGQHGALHAAARQATAAYRCWREAHREDRAAAYAVYRAAADRESTAIDHVLESMVQP